MLSFFTVGLITACEQQDEDKPIVLSLSGSTMGTTYSVIAINPPETLASVTLQKQIDDLLKEVNQQMSTYIDSAEIMQFNRVDVDQWQTISPGFLEVITLSQSIAEQTQGRFDITIGPLIELWGFGKREQGDIPTDSEIEAAKNRVGWQNLDIDQQNSAIKKRIPLWLDVSAVAKGYGVDQIARLLEQQNITRYLVEIGGEMKAKGYNRQNREWRQVQPRSDPLGLFHGSISIPIGPRVGRGQRSGGIHPIIARHH